MPDRRERHDFVVVWFPYDKPRRTVARRSMADALAYIESEELMQYAPLIEEQTVVTIVEGRVVWNSAVGSTLG